MKPYQANHKLYIGLLIGAITVAVTAFFIPMTSPWFTIISGLGCGGVASVAVAWLIDVFSCKQNNERTAKHQETLLKDLFGGFEGGIQPFIFMCEEQKGDTVEHRSQTWYDWIIEAHASTNKASKEMNTFINYYCVFAESILEKANLLNVQMSQLLDAAVIEDIDCEIITGIIQLCSLIRTECSVSKDRGELFDRILTYNHFLRDYIETSTALRPINTNMCKSILATLEERKNHV